MIRYGILSTAQVVPRFVAGVKEVPDCEVYAIASRSLAPAEKMAQELEIPHAYGSYQALCQDEQVDIVYIATYNQGHYPAAKLALENNKPVLLEKPFTLTSAEAEELFALAEEKNLFLMEAQKAVFLPTAKLIKEFIASGKLGRLHWIQSKTAYPNIDHVSWFRSLAAGGGALHGAGFYPLEYLQYILDQPITAFSGNAVFPKEQSDSQFNLTLTFGEQLLANIFITVDFATDNQMVIHGDLGRIEISDFWKTKTAKIIYNSGETALLTSDFTSEFAFEVAHVNHCLTEGYLTSPLMTKDITLTTVKMVESLYHQWLSK
ncbi:Gfo/Idh/MocA family protein [Enterococcus sp. LJL120]